MVERINVETVQLQNYDDPTVDSGYGEGAMEDAFIRFRQRTALELFGKLKNQNVLDLGCGRGEVVDVLTRAGVSAYGVDLAPQRVVDTAKKIPNGKFYIARVQELPFPNDTFRGITAFEIFEHLSPEDAKLMLKETWRVLAPGALLALSTPNELSIGGRVSRFVGKKSVREDHFNQVDYKRLSTMLKECGLVDIKLYGIGLLPGIWRLQHYLPFPIIHDFNINSAAPFPQFASESLAIARKPINGRHGNLQSTP